MNEDRDHQQTNPNILKYKYRLIYQYYHHLFY